MPARLGFLALLAASTAAPAFAAEEAAGGGGGGVFAGDIGNALWTIVIFLLLLVVLGKYAWGPILKSLHAREAFIRESLETAKRDRDAAEARLHEYEEKLAASYAEAAAIIEAARRDALALGQRLQEQARAESERTLERVRREIELAKAAAAKEVYAVAGRLAVDLASRIIGREIKPSDHERLIAESIEEIGALGGKAPGAKTRRDGGAAAPGGGVAG